MDESTRLRTCFSPVTGMARQCRRLKVTLQLRTPAIDEALVASDGCTCELDDAPTHDSNR